MIPYTGFENMDLYITKFSPHLLFMILSLVVIIILAYKEAKKAKLNLRIWKDFMYIFALLSIIGARIFSFLLTPQKFTIKEFFLGFFNTGVAGGESIGVAIIGLITGFLFLKIKKINPGKFFDTLAFPLSIGAIIARIGCSSVLDVTGKKAVLPWSLFYYNALRHPITFYYLINGIILAIIIISIKKHLKKKKINKPGLLFLSLITYYSLSRFLLDFFRVSTTTFLNIPLRQLLYLTVFIVSLTYLIKAVKK